MGYVEPGELPPTGQGVEAEGMSQSFQNSRGEHSPGTCCFYCLQEFHVFPMLSVLQTWPGGDFFPIQAASRREARKRLDESLS